MCYNKTYGPKIPELGLIAVSTMGHDKGRLYAVVAVLSADFVLCADGKVRTLANPKQKRWKHVKVLGSSDEVARAVLGGTLTDRKLSETLRRIEKAEQL